MKDSTEKKSIMRFVPAVCLSLLWVVTSAMSQGQTIYGLNEVPVVDCHAHFASNAAFDNIVSTMDEWGGAVIVNLWGSGSEAEQYLNYTTSTHPNRFVIAPRANGSHGYVWSDAELQHFADVGFAGIKTKLDYWAVTSEVPEIDRQIDKMGELGLPYIGLHIAQTPEATDPEHMSKYMVYQRDAESVINRHPNTTFIMAHMFCLATNDSSLDTLAMFFDRNANLYCDISSVWDFIDSPPEPTYTKFRDFLIRYKDRFVFGMDFRAADVTSQWYIHQRRVRMEPGGTYDLPLDVLNHIYYWNAAQLIPGVKEALEAQGYSISSIPPGGSTRVKPLVVTAKTATSMLPTRRLMHLGPEHLVGISDNLTDFSGRAISCERPGAGMYLKTVTE